MSGNEQSDNQKQFLEELNALTRKYKIVISGCGCCGSPSLDILSDEYLTERFHYTIDDYLKWEK